MYGSVQAAFQHGITAPLRRPRRDPPAAEVEQPRPQLQRIEGRDPLAGGDAPQQAPPPQPYEHRLHRNQVHRRRPDRSVNVENIGNANPAYSEDDTDAARPEAEQSVSADSENQRETQEGPAGATGSSVAAQTKTKTTESKPAQSKAKPLKVNENRSRDEPSREDAALTSEPAERQMSQTKVEVSCFFYILSMSHLSYQT